MSWFIVVGFDMFLRRKVSVDDVMYLVHHRRQVALSPTNPR